MRARPATKVHGCTSVPAARRAAAALLSRLALAACDPELAGERVDRPAPHPLLVGSRVGPGLAAADGTVDDLTCYIGEIGTSQLAEQRSST